MVIAIGSYPIGRRFESHRRYQNSPEGKAFGAVLVAGMPVPGTGANTMPQPGLSLQKNLHSMHNIWQRSGTYRSFFAVSEEVFVQVRAESIASPIRKQIKNAAPSIHTEMSIFSQTDFIPLMINRLTKLSTPLIAPPIAPPTTGTIAHRAGTFPQIKMRRNGSTDSAISYHVTLGVKRIFSVAVCR